jgi:hypothetical protein
MWTDTGAKCKIAAIITHDKAVLGLLVGSVLLARLSPIGAKVLVLLTISSCRMWSAWECHALWRQCRAKTASSARNFLVGMLVIHLLHLLTVWFTLGVNHYGWFSLVRMLCDLLKIKANSAGCVLLMRSCRRNLAYSPDLDPLPS